MKRTAFIQSRTKKCAVCRELYAPRNMQHKVCSSTCGLALAAKVRTMRERKADKVRKDALKPRSDHVKAAQVAFNAYIRYRDREQPCICCGRKETKVQGLGAHGWDCGHYRSTGSAPHLRFVEGNAHRQLVLCNRYGAGRAVDYRIGLIARIGLEAVEAIEADNNPRHYSVDDLKAIRAEYKQKLKQLQSGVTVDCNQPSPEQNQLGSRECLETV